MQVSLRCISLSFLIVSITLASIVFVYATAKHKAFNAGDPATEILINTSDSTIKLNGNILKNYELSNIEKIIGKPDRIKPHTFKSYYEMFGFEDTPPTSIPITVTDYYYIYDKLGIMFYTNNGRYGSKEPVCFSIHFKNKRTFDNTKALPYMPSTSFSGILKINGYAVNPDEKIIPQGVNYNTKEFKVYDVFFGPCSIASIIDRLYSMKSLPYIMIYLDNEKNQRISYIVI
jgi:hypothetical protein